MNNLKRVIAIAVTLAMLIPMCVVTVSADVADNWTTFAGKYTGGQFSTNKGKGFSFTETEAGGIYVDIPSKTQYGTSVALRAATSPISAVSSVNTTQLDGLTATVELDDTFTFSSINSASLSFLWTEAPVYTEDDAVYKEIDEAGNTTWTTSVAHQTNVNSNGLRNMVRTGTKGLGVTINNAYGKYDGTQTASNVMIYYFDGSFVDSIDQIDGYRWSFTARNYLEQSLNADSSGIVQQYERIDCSKGVTFSVRADETLGYIVSVNGTDYCLGSDVAYFPSNTGKITDEEYDAQSGNYIGSMTEAKADIDLSGLADITEGYLTIGSVGGNVATDEAQYTIKSVNHYPAATWAGEIDTHVCTPALFDTAWTSCLEPTYETYKCTECGDVTSVVEVAAAGHSLETLDQTFPDCTTDGVLTEQCSVCSEIIETVDRKSGHTWSKYTVVAEPTETEGGLRTRTCSVCETVEEQILPTTSSELSSYWKFDAHNEIDLNPDWVAGTALVYPYANGDGSILVNDYAREMDSIESSFAVTKAMSNFASSLDDFTATVTPVAFNTTVNEETGVDYNTVFADTVSFIWTNEPESYDDAAEYGPVTSTSWTSEQYDMRFGYVYDHELKGGEKTIVITLMDYMVTGNDSVVYGVMGDGVYDIAVYSIISGGNFWASKFISNVGVTAGAPIDISMSYKESKGNYILSTYINGTKYPMPEALSSQTLTDEYYFGVASYSYAAGSRGTAFEINSICGEAPATFDGYQAPEHIHVYDAVVTTAATCHTEGLMTYTCACGDSYTEVIPAVNPDGDHSWPIAWVDGEDMFTKVRACTICGEIQTTKAFVDNYIFGLDKGVELETIRVAPGTWTTSGEIKAAAGMLTLNTSTIAKWLVDGELRYEVPDGGVYSMWVRLSDKSTMIFTGLDFTYMTQSVSNYGVNITVHDLYGVKDFFIAPGTLSTYSEIKKAYIVNVTSTKIGAAHDFTYPVTKEGDYTVCVRYTDSTRANEFLYLNIDVINPIFTGNGLQLTVGNIEGVKSIRTAYGEYSSVTAIKSGDRNRAFGKSLYNGKDSYTIQYRDEGLVTVSVQYVNGYTEYYTYNVTKKVPTVEVDYENRTVTFGDLDGMYIVRYAAGKYSTSNNIKKAPNSKYAKADSMNENGQIVIALPDAGMYSFCVQYDDESYNYYRYTFE